MKPILLCLALALPLPARAADLTLDQIVARARAQREKRADKVVCSIVVDSELRDKAGNVEHSDNRRGSATLTRGSGDDVDVDVVATSGTHDGKPLSAAELAAEHKKALDARHANQGRDMAIIPLAKKNAGQQTFTLVRKETLWGRPAYVLAVKAQPTSSNHASLATGTLWIDADSFVELKGELEPLELPPHADWLKVQEQFVLGPGGTSVPSLLKIEGGGSMMFIRKSFRSTLRWSDCH
jgi:hypothetical protein